MQYRVTVRGFSWVSEGITLDFLQPVPHQFTCVSCRDLVGILWHSPCQHSFCTRCLEGRLGQGNQSECPVDLKPILRSQLVEDASIQEKVSNFQVHCPNRDRGCTATPLLSNFSEHTRHCMDNPTAPPLEVPPGSGDSSSAPGPMALGCWMSQFGCTFSGPASELETHEADWALHRRLVLMQLAQYKRSLEDIQNERDLLRNQLNEAHSAVKGLRLDFEQHRVQSGARTDQLQRQIESANQRLAQLEGSPPQGGSLLPSMYPELPSIGPQESLCAASNDLSLLPDASLATVAGTSDQVCSDGTFAWRLAEYSRAKRKERHAAHRYTSGPIFITGNPGYRLQLRVHLNGLGQSRKGKFLAVQLVLYRGPNDPQLPWPLRRAITVTLVDQVGTNHVSYTINDPGFPRPQSDHTAPYTWQEFVSQQALESQQGLLHNDSLLFKVYVAAQ